MDSGWLYIARERQFIELNTDIFKIGKTSDVNSLKPRYPKGTLILFTCFTNYIKIIEDKVKIDFPLVFIPRIDYGSEYFQGDFRAMRFEMMKIINYHDDCVFDSNKIDVPITKTLRHFCNEVIEITNNYTIGVCLDNIHNAYIENWLPKNTVDIPYMNLQEFGEKISKIFGKPVKNSGSFIFYGKSIKQEFIPKKTQTKVFDPYKIQEYRKDIDLYKQFVNEHLVKDVSAYVQWSDLKYNFYNWLSKHNMIHIIQGLKIDQVREHFSIYLGKYANTRKNGDKVNGFLNWKLINNCFK